MKAPSVEVVDTNGERTLGSTSWDVRLFLNICDISGWATEKQIEDFTRSRALPITRAVSQLEPVLLPDNWLCYVPFQAVFIKEIAYNYLAPPEKDALLQWVDSGGFLVVYGSDQNKEVAQALGTIQYQSLSPLDMGNLEKKIANPVWLDVGKSRGSMRDFPYLVKRTAGKYGGFLLATAFLIVAGPVNYSFWKKRKRIRMILVALPVISISFCMMIIFYFVVTQGFAKKGGTFSITILDENRDAALTFSRSCLFSGLYPLGGFQFDRTTGFHSFNQTKDFSMDFTSSMNLKSGIFTPSVNFHYLTVTPFKTRERLVYDPLERSVTNGFEQKIEGLIWNEGGQLMIARDLAPGQKKKLEWYEATPSSQYTNPFSPDIFYKEFLSEPEAKFGKAFIGNFMNQPFIEGRVKYMARFKDNPPSVQTGVRISSKKNTPVLVGLELE
jgi:hypothetical protein